MNNRALSLSIIMAIAATFFVYSYVSSIEDEAKKKFGATVLVVTAKRDIREMETINETMIQLTPVPKRFVEPASISFEQAEESKETAKSMKGLAGAVAIVPIKKDEQVSYNKLTEPNVRTGLAPQVAPGRRAVAIPVTEVSSVSKLLKPGDRIDLIAVIKTGNSKDGRIAKTILQDTVVLSTGKAVSNNVARVVETDAFGGKERVRNLAEETGFSTITVEVEPQQAEILALITSDPESTLEISLRNNDDTDRVPLTSVMIDDVLGADGIRVRAPASLPPGGRR